MGSKIYIKLHFVEGEERSEIGGDTSVCATVVNETDSSLEAQRLEVVPCGYLYPSSAPVEAVAAYCETDVIIKLRGQYNADVSEVPDKLKLKLSKSNLDFCPALPFGLFTKRLQQYTPVGLPGADGSSNFSILFVGLAGSTKSSTIKSALTLMGSAGTTAIREHSDLKRSQRCVDLLARSFRGIFD